MKKINASKLFVVLLWCMAHVAVAQRPAVSVTLFRDSAEAGAWCPYDSTLVAYNLLQPNGYYGIYLANVGPLNTRVNERCFTCSNITLPGKNVAQPAFDPLGRYILFTAEKAVHSGPSANCIPGIGSYNDLWVMTLNGTKAYRLTTTPATGLSGMIEPYFSPDGKEVMWASMVDSVNIFVGRQEFGYWAVNIAPFIDDTINGPHIDSLHIRTIQPGGTGAFNEPYGWSPDGKKILFASDYNQFWVWDDQIYTMDTLGNNIEQMSSTAHSYPYCEHAFYDTYGNHIVWMTNLDNNVGGSKGGDDWWIMNSDTTHQERLTYFNDTTCAYWTGNIHINGHGSFSPRGTKFIGDVGGSQPVQVNPAASIGAEYIITTGYLTGVNEVNAGNENVKVFPNPSNGIFQIQANSQQLMANSHIEVYNMLGEKIANSQWPSANSQMQIDLSNRPAGVYLYRLISHSGNLVSSGKLILK